LRAADRTLLVLGSLF